MYMIQKAFSFRHFLIYCIILDPEAEERISMPQRFLIYFPLNMFDSSTLPSKEISTLEFALVFTCIFIAF